MLNILSNRLLHFNWVNENKSGILRLKSVVHMIQKLKLKLIVVVIKEFMKLKKTHRQMVFVMVLRTFVRFDTEILEDMKYQSEKYVSMIGFSYVDMVSLFLFL